MCAYGVIADTLRRPLSEFGSLKQEPFASIYTSAKASKGQTLKPAVLPIQSTYPRRRVVVESKRKHSHSVLTLLTSSFPSMSSSSSVPFTSSLLSLPVGFLFPSSSNSSSSSAKMSKNNGAVVVGVVGLLVVVVFGLLVGLDGSCKMRMLSVVVGGVEDGLANM
jgi:hypothetical protein